MTEDRGRRPISVFYSYSHRDETLRDELAKHFQVLERCGLIDQWHDRKILAGDEWDRQISTYLEIADIILLLVSVDFLASRYCFDVETALALKRHDAGEARVIPVILRPAVWKITPLGRLQALPKDARPVTGWPNQDEAFQNICEGILAVAVAWRNETAAAPPRSTPSLTPEEKARPALPARQRRVLDGALPVRVPVGTAIVLVAMIRRSESSGLRGILQVETRYGARPEDVRSTPVFRVEFPVDATGNLVAAELTLKVDSPDFEPATQSKPITIDPDGDSEPRIFLMTARREGELNVHLELLQKGTSLIDGLLKTTAVAADEVGSRSHTLVSLLLDPASASARKPVPSAPSIPRTETIGSRDDTTVVAEPAPTARRRSRRLRPRVLGAAGVLSAALLCAVWFAGQLRTAAPVDLRITSTSTPTGTRDLVAVKGETSGPSENVYVLIRPVGQSRYVVAPVSFPAAKDGSWQAVVKLPGGPGQAHEVVAISTPQKLKEGVIDAVPPDVRARSRAVVR